MTALSTYRKKRNFEDTPEPEGTVARKKNYRFVVQKHNATRLHYDFRLQLDGVLKSWAVPKGPSLQTGVKRLAIQVEDHPIDYIDFKGTIPEGNYGAGDVEIYDCGTFETVDEDYNSISEKQALKNLDNGELKIVLHGKKLKNGYVLVRMHDKNWLLIKHKKHAALKGKG